MIISKQNYIMILLQAGWQQLCYEADYITLGRGRVILGFPLYIIISFGTLEQEWPLGENPAGSFPRRHTFPSTIETKPR
jgi:hypothetical protein